MESPLQLDCPPQPRDDQNAGQLLCSPDGRGSRPFYDSIDVASGYENPFWLDYLPRNESGQIPLDPNLAVQLSLLHSRDYQAQFEDVYLTALQLDNNRFEFETQWFGGNQADFTWSGEDLGSARQLDVTVNRLGFTRNLAGGGQLATSLLNSLVWDFGGGGLQAGSASLVATFTQPLLRGAFRHVRLETLTQAERNLLYSVRDFARFRRLFFVDISTGYLRLLNQKQAIQNLRANLNNLRSNLQEYDFYVQLEIVSQVERDQVFQQYQNGRVQLLAAEQQLAESMDDYKFLLGLPSWTPLQLDDAILNSFQLASPELTEIQAQTQALFVELMQYLPPEEAPHATLMEALDRYEVLSGELDEVLPGIEADLSRWQSRLDGIDASALGIDDRLDIEQQQSLLQQVIASVAESKTSLTEARSNIASLRAEIESLESGADAIEQPTPAQQAWQRLQQAISISLRGNADDLFVAQTQIRLFLIEVEPIEVVEEQAIRFAHANRVDLMNTRGTVHDAFRQVEVAADALESDLALTGAVVIGSDPDRNNAFRLDSSANQYSVGVQFDGPLNRQLEQSGFRAAQIQLQRANRNFVAARDGVANEVRTALRQLELSRLSFQIARQQLVAATRQVDQAQIDLRRSTQGNANLTLLLLDALQGVLDARNNLIGNWIQYRVQKMQLFAALDLLYLDEEGNWINETEGLGVIASGGFEASDYFPFEGTGVSVPGESIPDSDSQSPDSTETRTPQGDLAENARERRGILRQAGTSDGPDF